MKWDDLPIEIIEIILKERKYSMCKNYCASYIQSHWKKYRTKVLIGRFKMLRHIKIFKYYNPNILEFIIRSKL
tara:strand:- start:1511 stop:1729 length:219 start_codon:yes stop_codon:yes gene_type:complete